MLMYQNTLLKTNNHEGFAFQKSRETEDSKLLFVAQRKITKAVQPKSMCFASYTDACRRKHYDCGKELLYKRSGLHLTKECQPALSCIALRFGTLVLI